MGSSKIIPLAVVGVLAVAMWLTVGAGDARLWIRPGQSVETTEDSPGWDCRTMGNRVCGQRP